MARGLLFPAVMLALAAPAGASAQSMNTRQIVDEVMGEVCRPLADRDSLWAAVRAAERLGYSITSVEPVTIRIGAANRQPELRAVTLARRHHGTVRVSRDYDHVLCSVAIEEGSAAWAIRPTAPSSIPTEHSTWS